MTPTTARSRAVPGEGDRPLVVSYASSPVAEVVLRGPAADDARPRLRSLDGCYRQVEFAGVLAGTRPTGRWRARSSTSC